MRHNRKYSPLLISKQWKLSQPFAAQHSNLLINICAQTIVGKRWLSEEV